MDYQQETDEEGQGDRLAELPRVSHGCAGMPGDEHQAMSDIQLIEC